MADIFITGSDGTARDCWTGDLWFPYIGNWTCRLTLTDSDPPPTGQVTVSFHGLILSGTVLRSGIAEDLNTVLVAGGRGGLWMPIRAKMYDNLHSVELVVGEILSDAGEDLSLTSSPAILAQTLPQYPRLADEPQHLLDTLCDVLSGQDQRVVWRAIPDGSIFFGVDSWTDLTGTYTEGTATQDPQYQLIKTEPSFGNLQLINPISIAVFPGTSFLLGKVGTVRYLDDGTSFIGRIYYFDPSGPGEDPMSAGFRAIVREEIRGTTFHPCFTGRVVTQWSTGLIDVEMDDIRLPPLTNIPYRVPFPGCSMSIPANSRVQVDFEGGDPRKAAARMYEPSTNATREIALSDDQVDCGTMVLNVTGGAMAPAVLGGLYTDPFGGMTTITSGVSIPLKGKVRGSGPIKFP